MVKDGIVSGPFDTPPFPEFRANPLFVIEWNKKLRLILDLSSLKGTSFNYAIDPASVPNISMTLPRDVADLLVEFGSSAYLSKLDYKSAFGLVPVHSNLVKSQGLHFLAKVFC